MFSMNGWTVINLKLSTDLVSLVWIYAITVKPGFHFFGIFLEVHTK